MFLDPAGVWPDYGYNKKTPRPLPAKIARRDGSLISVVPPLFAAHSHVQP